MLLSATQAFAQEGVYYPTAISSPEGQPARRQMMQDAVNARRDMRQGAEQQREYMRGVATSTREQQREAMHGIASSTRAEMENIREAAKQKMEQIKKDMEVRKEAFKKEVEVKKEEAKKKIEENRAALQGKLKNIKDEKKKTAVETVDKRLAEINADRLTHFTDVLDQMDKVLQNIGSREAKVGAAGKDVSVVTADIAAAQSAIAAARAAIVTQTGKTYVLAISQENTLRMDVGKARQALGTDLKVVQDKVSAAHDAIRKAATDLAKIPGVDDVDVQASAATTTATSSNR